MEKAKTFKGLFESLRGKVTAMNSKMLARILEEPKAIAVIQHLDPRILYRLVNQIGLEDAGEIVKYATTDQLKKLFDEDLWSNQKPGAEEKLDTSRFVLWLSVMLDIGTEYTISKITELDEDFLVAVLSKHLLVQNLDDLTLMNCGDRPSQSLDDVTQKVLEGSLNHEFDEYIAISRDYNSWTPIFTLLVNLDEEHHDLLMRLLERCCYISNEYVEDNGGLCNVLTAEEQVETDVAWEREQRRKKEGFVLPLEAKAFLRVATDNSSEDHYTNAYFRDLEDNAIETRINTTNRSKTDKAEMLLEFLKKDSELVVENAVEPEDNRLLIKDLLHELREHYETSYTKRVSELNYLSNVLISGCSFENRKLREVEASELVLSTCNLGILISYDTDLSRVDLLRTIREADLVSIFRAGWSTVYQEVTLFALGKLSNRLRTLIDQNRSDKWLLGCLCSLQNQVDAALKNDEFDELREKENDEWFSELCFCLLTANSRASSAIKIQNQIGARGFLNSPKENIAQTIKMNKHRFHNNKAKYIVGAREFKNIKEILKNKEDFEAREFIVENVKGLGMKEASHFLRNVGRKNLAILDRHILNLLYEEGYLLEKPKTLTPKVYKKIEETFNRIAERLKMSSAELDLYMWYMKTGIVLK